MTERPYRARQWPPQPYELLRPVPLGRSGASPIQAGNGQPSVEASDGAYSDACSRIADTPQSRVRPPASRTPRRGSYARPRLVTRVVPRALREALVIGGRVRGRSRAW